MFKVGDEVILIKNPLYFESENDLNKRYRIRELCDSENFDYILEELDGSMRMMANNDDFLLKEIMDCSLYQAIYGSENV